MSTTALIPQSDLDRLVVMVVDSVSSQHSKRAYRHALELFLRWYIATEPGPFSRATVLAYKSRMEALGSGRATINLALAALRKLAQEAAANGLLDESLAAGISVIRGANRLGTRAGNWLTRGEALELLRAPDTETLKGKRDKLILGLLVGCGLRRDEAAGLTVAHIQTREERACIVDLVGKGGRIRTVPLPRWVARDLGLWLEAACITEGRLLRPMDKGGRIVGEEISGSGLWWIVKEYARAIGKPELAPHDLRRTCSKLAQKGGADVRKIQHLLGHSSLVTTEGYIGQDMDLDDPANDYLGLEDA